MSNEFNNNSATNTFAPRHAMHDSSEPLPGVEGGGPTVDYTPDTMQDTRLPGSHPNRHGQDLLQEYGNTAPTPASAEMPTTGSGEGFMGGTTGSDNIGPARYEQPTTAGTGMMGEKPMGPGNTGDSNLPELHKSGQYEPPTTIGGGGGGGTTGLGSDIRGLDTGAQNLPELHETRQHEQPATGTGARNLPEPHTTRQCDQPSTTQTGIDSTAPQQHTAGRTGGEPKDTTGGGVHPGGKPKFGDKVQGLGDKVIGKTQKMVGKIARDAEMQEKGQARESGGLAGVMARKPEPRD